LVFSSYLALLSTPNPNPSSQTPNLLILEAVLRNPSLKVLELGAGCGIVGISLANIFPHQITLTDLPEAAGILAKNLSLTTLPLPIRSRLSSQVLDWLSPLPANIASTSWDLILVADCTYNPDVVPDLVATLKSLAFGEGGDGKGGLLVALAMKVRHESEMVFFALMREGGFVVRENCRIPLPVLGGEREEIEIFVFEWEGRGS